MGFHYAMVVAGELNGLDRFLPNMVALTSHSQSNCKCQCERACLSKHLIIDPLMYLTLQLVFKLHFS